MFEKMDKKFLTLIKKGICENWDNPALTDIQDKTYTYNQLAEEIAKLQLVFQSLGIQKGDKVALCDRNSSHWVIAFFATMSYGAVPTTILNEFSGENIENIVNHSESVLLFMGNQTKEKINLDNLPNISSVILLEDFSLLKSGNPETFQLVMDLEIVFNQKYPLGFSKEDMFFHNEKFEGLAMLNYTSGTTSSPKGVMIPYCSLWSNTRFAIDRMEYVKPGAGVVCMLPIAHMYGLAFEVLLSVAKGSHVHFLNRLPSPLVILDAFANVNPTLILSVPLILEKIIQNKVFPQLKAFPVNVLRKIPIVKDVIHKKIAKQIIPLFGSQMREMIVGGAAMNQEVSRFLSVIKFPYTVGYGMTECGPLITYINWENYVPGSCGRSVDRLEVVIDSPSPQTEAGEILIKGDNVMMGYYHNEEATKAAFTGNGWLRTGDLAVMDADGNIFIKGRSKTMILTASGQNIYPEEIEEFYNASPYVNEVLIIEEDKKLIALIYPDKDYMDKMGIQETQYADILRSEMTAINKKLPNYSKINNFRIQETEFEKTPKRSIKRFLYQK